MESKEKHEEESIKKSQFLSLESEPAKNLAHSQPQETRLPVVPFSAGVEGPAAVTTASNSCAIPESSASSPDGLSDDALALMFASQHGGELRYTAALGRWNIFDGTRWVLDEKLEVLNRSRELCRTAAAPFRDTPRIVNRMRSAGTIRAVENLARCDRRLAASSEQWDADPLLLNTPDGVVDLRTGSLRPARREDYMTRITAVGPGGECPTWLRFLARITGEDVELQQYLQTVAGYALTGLNSEQCLFFLYGTGGNGKSIFTGTIEKIMNSYGRHAPIETFIASNHQQHPTDLASLVGARMVLASETQEGQRLAESRVKSITGGEKIAARYMRQDFFEFTPTFKLFISGNHKPIFRNVDESIRRRFRLVPFGVTIPRAERDLQLGERLVSEWSGILRWMVSGCLRWQSEGLHEPSAVAEATEQYLMDQDVIRRWIDENCETGANVRDSSTDLYSNWRAWAEARSEYVGSPKQFAGWLESRGFQRARVSTQRLFVGLRVRTGEMTGVTGETFSPSARVGSREEGTLGEPSHPSLECEDRLVV